MLLNISMQWLDSIVVLDVCNDGVQYRKCNGVGDDGNCVRQNNLWRCVSRQSSDSWPHRQPYEPLDVQHTSQDNEQDEEQEKVGDSTVIRTRLLDRLLRLSLCCYVLFAFSFVADICAPSLCTCM
jgi:hypothetical protein